MSFSDHYYFSVSWLVIQWNSRQNIAQKIVEISLSFWLASGSYFYLFPVYHPHFSHFRNEKSRCYWIFQSVAQKRMSFTWASEDREHQISNNFDVESAGYNKGMYYKIRWSKIPFLRENSLIRHGKLQKKIIWSYKFPTNHGNIHFSFLKWKNHTLLDILRLNCRKKLFDHSGFPTNHTINLEYSMKISVRGECFDYTMWCLYTCVPDPRNWVTFPSAECSTPHGRINNSSWVIICPKVHYLYF